ncbi:SMP-30/gluconolactonase/LRE family protein [Corynebacterium variabile]|uniref:SMP-30/gluconolactonase/LRE family protein n=1 Tax=Corynebacterium variabile TaxID=1727 RepID=UPI00289B0313|nr:SMP-30/gluconolactonase/LRE family protein [Corynebacterium variabile]
MTKTTPSADNPAPTTVATGMTFTECPRWHGGRWYFVDFYSHRVLSMEADGADLRTELTVPAQPSGLGWLPDGRLLVVSMKDRKILRREADGSIVEHADLSDLAAYPLNDMVVDEVGRAYVGNFGFDLMAAEDAAPTPLILVDTDGSARVISEPLYFPNGSVITPDGKTLIVDETFGNRVSAFDILEDGSLGPRRDWAVFGPLSENRKLDVVEANSVVSADGCGLDADGNLWVADALGGPTLLVAEGGEILRRVSLDSPVFACMAGGPDGRDLFLSCAPDFDEERRSATPEATVRLARITTPHGGRP